MTIKDYKTYLNSLDKYLLLKELSELENHLFWIKKNDPTYTSKVTLEELSFTHRQISDCMKKLKNSI